MKIRPDKELQYLPENINNPQMWNCNNVNCNNINNYRNQININLNFQEIFLGILILIFKKI